MAKSTNSRRKASGSAAGIVGAVAALMRQRGCVRYALFCPNRPLAAPESMRIVTLNVNGLRSAAGKGFPAWMRRQKADVVCLQEIKAQEADLPKTLLATRGLNAFFHPAEKKGYSGVTILFR